MVYFHSRRHNRPVRLPVVFAGFTFGVAFNSPFHPPEHQVVCMSGVIESRQIVRSDGSAEADTAPTVVIKSDDEIDRMRYRCPNNHTRWAPTNNHVYCHSCAQFQDAGEGPEYWELLDAKTGETISWDQVVLR